MNKEEKEAIDILQNCIADYVIGDYCEKCEDRLICKDRNEDCYFQQAIDIVVNLIQKQEKIIDKMAEQIDKFNSSSGLDEDCFITREYSSIDDCIKKQSCKECIKEYFKKEVEKDVKD